MIDWSVNAAAGDHMDFKLSDEQREFQQKCRRFAAEVIRPVAAQHDRDESVPWEAIKAAREWGLHGLETIQQMAEDPDGLFSCIYAEELHWGCAGIALAIQGGSLAAAGIASSGTPEQIGRWVPECFGMGDEIKLGAYAVTEPSAGSDVRSLRTTAKQDGDEWVLNGTKVFITNGGIADVTVVVATVDPDLGHRGQASFVVPKGTPGLSQGKKESKLGIRASQTTEVILEDCRVPMENLLGGYDKLQKKLERARSGQATGRSSNALATFELTRPLVGASALGIAQAAYEWTLEYLEDKEENGQPLKSDFYGILHEGITGGATLVSVWENMLNNFGGGLFDAKGAPAFDSPHSALAAPQRSPTRSSWCWRPPRMARPPVTDRRPHRGRAPAARQRIWGAN